MMSGSATFRIHPAIGFARVGNSPEYNLAPETMTGIPDDSGLIGGIPIKDKTEADPIYSSDLRDKQGRLKRQAARFRIFTNTGATDCYPIGKGQEIKIGQKIGGRKVKDIIWTVHIANKKATAPVFENPNLRFLAPDPETYQTGTIPVIDGYTEGKNPYEPGTDNPFPPLRNPTLTGEDRYRDMVIDPGPRALSAAGSDDTVELDAYSQANYFDPTTKAITPVAYPKRFPDAALTIDQAPHGIIHSLGTATCDPQGRLIVAGGYGRAMSFLLDCDTPPPLDGFVDNDGWFDDTGDGPVHAAILFDDGSVEQAAGGWLVATDPGYAPQVLNTVSLWDELYDTFVRNFALVPGLYSNGYNANYKVAFDLDVKPFLRSVDLQQANTNWPQSVVERHAVVSETTTLKDFPYQGFIRKRDEGGLSSKMPASLGDTGTPFLTPTETMEFLIFQAIENGDSNPAPPLGSGEFLDRASLQNCLGGRLSPGIDMTFVIRDPYFYQPDWQAVGPFRINGRIIDYGALPETTPVLGEGYLPTGTSETQPVEPGDATKFMALPWHTDYNSCAVHEAAGETDNPGQVYWSWPAQRPYAVRLASEVDERFSFSVDSLDSIRRALQNPTELPRGVDVQTASDILNSHIQDFLTIVLVPCDTMLSILQSLISTATQQTEPYVTFFAGFATVRSLSDYRYSVRGRYTTGAYGPSSGIFFNPIHMVENWQNIGVNLQAKQIDTVPVKPRMEDTILETVSQLQIEGDMEVVRPWPDFPSASRELFYGLLNVDTNPQIVPKARMFTESVLAGARAFMMGETAPGYIDTIDELGKFFPYSKSAFTKRIDDLYRSLVQQEEGYQPAIDTVFRNRASVIERIIQFAPFNLTDGCWLRNVNGSGPMDEVRVLVDSVEQDERGDGDISMNHPNIYQDLCHEVGFYPYPLESYEFAMDERFMDSSFDVAAFELSISQFTESYFPEILGMTLQLEWSVVELKNTIKLLEFYGINPHFYVMHVGIDNATNGHGERARQAIDLYLDNILATAGEEAVQEAWMRIWSGYVAFAYYSSFGEDLNNRLESDPNSPVELQARMLQLVRDKKAYGQYNHDENQIGGTKINLWFADPPGFLQALVDSGYIVPGDPDNSRFFTLLEFETGPMYRVFTEDEIDLWKRWTLSLGDQPVQTEPELARCNMIKVIETLNLLQEGTPDHGIIYLTGPDGQKKSVSEWFAGDPGAFLDALADESNGVVVRGSPWQSRLLTELMAPSRPMGVACQTVIAGTGLRAIDLTELWIRSLLPTTATPPPVPRKLWLSAVHQTNVQMKQKIQGQGAIH